jgi:DNA-binding NtrC family response regulator
MTHRVLSVGLPSDIFSTRNAVLRQAGYLVRPATDLNEALRLFKDEDFDATVICHLVPLHRKDRLIRQMKELKPLTPVISMTDGTTGPPADAEIFNLDGPEALLKWLKKLVGEASKGQSGTQ